MTRAFGRTPLALFLAVAMVLALPLAALAQVTNIELVSPSSTDLAYIRSNGTELERTVDIAYTITVNESVSEEAPVDRRIVMMSGDYQVTLNPPLKTSAPGLTFTETHSLAAPAGTPEGLYSIQVSASQPASGSWQLGATWLRVIMVDNTPPTAPGEPVVSGNDGEFTVNWEPATDPLSEADVASGIAGYRLERSTDGGSTWTVLDGNLEGLSHVDEDVSSPGIYLYRVKAFDKAGNPGPYSVSDPVTVEAPEKPPVEENGPYTVFGQGYWKNRVESWPVTITGSFFLTDKDWVETMNTSASGDAYYILAPHYIASHLNMNLPVNAALTPPGHVVEAFNQATYFFETTPGLFAVQTRNRNFLGAMDVSREMRQQVLVWAEILENWNSGR